MKQHKLLFYPLLSFSQSDLSRMPDSCNSLASCSFPIILCMDVRWLSDFFYGLTKVSKGVPKEVSEYKHMCDLTEENGFDTTVLRANNGIIYTDSLSSESNTPCLIV